MAAKPISRRSFLKKSTLLSVSVSPVIKPLSTLFGIDEKAADGLVDLGFRLVKPESLVSLEFYFINVAFRDGCIFSKPRLLTWYSEERSYMIVRLPQQHIAEQNYDTSTKDGGCIFDDKAAPEPNWVAKVCISGFSYLVFRLMPDPENKKLKIPINEQQLLNWNDERKYQLVIRQNLNESLFNIKIAAPTGAPFYENTYPLSYSPGAQGKYQFDRDRFPKVYGDPVTAIEAPWRMLVSPQLNDPRQFRFKWIFTHSAADRSSRAELWMAILTVEPRPVIYPHSRVIGDEKIFQDVNDDFFSNLNLMFIGSPDHPVPSDAADKYFMTSPGINAKVNILPHASDRYALVQLYIKYKLLARTSNLSFSQLGIGAYIEFKNTKVSVTTLQTPQIILNSYKHLISFGRDEAVEVTYLMLDKETGLKMLLIKTTKRRTKGGESYLDYREYIKPLDPEKDYTSHADDKGISKFRAPFKKIKFLDLDPKRICGVNSGVYNNTNSNLSIPLSGGTDPEGCFYPITSDAKGNQRFLTFYMEITDWHDQVHRIHKKIQAVTFGTNARLANPADLTLDKIDAVFDSDSTGAELSAAELEKTNQDIDTNFVALVNSVKTFAEGAGGQGEHTFFDETVIQLTEIKNLLPGGQLGELINTRKNLFLNLLAAKENEFKRVVQQKIDTISLDVTNYKTRFSQKVIDLRADAAAVQVKIDDIIAGAKAEADLLTADLNTQLKALSIRAGKVKEMLNEFFTLNDSNNDAEDQLSADQTALYKAQHAPHPDPVEIKRLQDLIAQLKITLQQYKDQYNALLLKYAQLLQSEGLAGAADLDRLVTNVNKKFQEITTQAGDLDKHIKKIVQTVTNKYAATKDALTKQVKALGDRADALDKQIKDELGKIKSGVKAQSLLQITQDVQNWFQTLTTEIPALQTKFENTLKGNFSDFLSDPVDQAVNDINKIIVNLKTRIHTVPIVDADGSPILDTTNTAIQYDLSPVFADYFDSVISDVKLAFFDFSYRYVRALKDFDTELLLTIQGFRKSFVDGVLQKLDDLHNNEKLLKNAIYTYRNKIGYAVNQLQDAADEINGELSALETDFFVLKGELRTIVDGVKPQVIDFFHQYASIPQLKTAQVYISSISKLVNEETSVAIGYAQDYINSQTDLYNLNVEKNATRVFAELKDYSKNQIKGKLRNLSEHFGGMINPEIPVDFLSYLRDPRKIEDQVIANLPDSVKAGIANSKKVVEDLKNQVAATRQEITNAVGAGEQQLQALNNKLKQQLDDYKNAINASPIVKDLVLIGSDAKSFYDEAKSFSPDSFFKNLEAKLFGTIYLKDILGLDFQLPRLSPSRDEITYNFITNKIQSKDFSFFRFSASDQTQFQIYFSKSLKAAQTYSAFTRLSNFKLIIVLVSEDVLLVKFKEFRVSSDNGNSKQVSVSLDGVAFGGPLDFFGKLAEKLQLPGSGLRIRPSSSQLEVGYGFPLPSISAPGFNFANVKFDVNLVIPYANGTSVSSLILEAGINRDDDQFLLSVGIFGGMGYFTMSANPDSIIKIKTGIAFGGYFGINLGIASGYVFLFAGIALTYEKSGNLTLVGYLICEGGVTVFGFISIYLTVMLSMTYQRVDGVAALYGSASLRYSIKIGFFKKSFEIAFSKTFAGARGNSIAQTGGSAALRPAQKDTYYASAVKDPSIYADYELQYVEDHELPEKKPAEDNALFDHIYSHQDWEDYFNAFQL